MSPARARTPGATRNCPHCRSVILESAARCPKCQHHLRFDGGGGERAAHTLTPLRVEGTIRPPPEAEAWEYSVVLTIRDARGEEVTRHIVGVGAVKPGDERTFALSVEVTTVAATSAPR